MSGFLFGEVVTAIVAALKATSAVSTPVNNRIYATPPDGQLVFPFISFGSLDAEDFSHKTKNGQKIRIQIDVWSRYEGPLEVSNISKAVYDLLHKSNLSIPSGSAFLTRVTNFTILTDDDGGTRHGVVTVEVLTIGS